MTSIAYIQPSLARRLIIKKRAQLSISIATLARRAHLPEEVVVGVENGTIPPTRYLLTALVNALNITEADIQAGIKLDA